jgi:prolactin regulatory element-binding protein
VTAFNRTKPSLIAIGSTNSQLSVLTYPALEDVFPPITYDGEEIYDVDFDDSGEMVCSLFSCHLTILADVIGNGTDYGNIVE